MTDDNRLAQIRARWESPVWPAFFKTVANHFAVCGIMAPSKDALEAIAHAPEDVAHLLEELDRLRGLLTEAGCAALMVNSASDEDVAAHLHGVLDGYEAKAETERTLRLEAESRAEGYRIERDEDAESYRHEVGKVRARAEAAEAEVSVLRTERGHVVVRALDAEAEVAKLRAAERLAEELPHGTEYDCSWVLGYAPAGDCDACDAYREYRAACDAAEESK